MNASKAKEFICEYCDNEFTRKNSLNVHLKTCEDKKNYDLSIMQKKIDELNIYINEQIIINKNMEIEKEVLRERNESLKEKNENLIKQLNDINEQINDKDKMFKE